MVEAILFDFGGVITESPFEAFNAFEHERGLPINFIRDLNSSSHDLNEEKFLLTNLMNHFAKRRSAEVTTSVA